MNKVTILVDKNFKISEVDQRLFGSFVEHMGRVVYDGLYDPGHEKSNSQGFRMDVLEFIKEMNLSVIRYPGGNFVSGYNWEDGVGPASERPTRLDLAWQATETNQFGLNEFMDWIKEINADTIMAVNLGTRGIDAARSLIEYCNHESGTYWSELRKSHGYNKPHNIKSWCLGNEMDGPWQIGTKTAHEYGRLAVETAKTMKLVDPDIELVVCGSSLSSMPSFPQWDLTVLEHTYEHVDYLALHQYYINTETDTKDFLANSVDFDNYIKTAISTIDFVKAKKRSNKTVNISIDEWNVVDPKTIRPEKIDGWPKVGVRGETIYTLEDALLAGSMLITMLNHSDRVKIACQSLLLNVSGYVMTEENGGAAWKQVPFYPFKHVTNYGKGVALKQIVDTPRYDSKNFKDVPTVDSAVVLDEQDGTCTIFAVNKSTDDSINLACDLAGIGEYTIEKHTVLEHSNINAINSAANPENVFPHDRGNATIQDGSLTADLPKLSWNVIRLVKK